MKKLTLILAAVLMASVFALCSKEEEVKTPETNAPETQAATTPAETEPETEPETEAETEPEVEPVKAELPKQGEVPCNFDDSYDLSDDILHAEFSLADSAGQWVLGDDGTQMSNELTGNLLTEYKYLAFTYDCDVCDEDSTIALMWKFVHEDGTKSEILCDDWQEFGPEGMTTNAADYSSMNVYGEQGVFYVTTESLLAHEAYVEGDVINQIGLAAVEYSGTYVELNITGAYLTK